jgi:hypothetical protein
VLGPEVWRWSDLEADWDSLMLESWVDGQVYQSSKAAVFRKPTDLLKVLSERVTTLPSSYLVYCGTYTTVDTTIRFGDRWTASLSNPRNGQELTLGYDVVDLLEEIEPGFRVPLRPQEN